MKYLRSAKAIILDGDNNVLVLRRSETHPWLPLKPDLPGGVIEDNEDHMVGLVREIFEETKIVVAPHQLKELDMDVHAAARIVATIERSLYAVRFTDSRPEVEISWEHDEFYWVPVHTLTTLEKPVQRQLNKVIKQNILDSL